MEKLIVLPPLRGSRILWGERPAQVVCIGNAPAPILGIVMVCHTVAAGRGCHHHVKGGI
jgi:hypothetical protein